MERDWTDREDPMTESQRDAETQCWKELLDQAVVGVTPVDQTVEYILDRMEKGRS